MFEEVNRLLQGGQAKYSVEMELPADSDGYIDKECPHADCKFGFKVRAADWKAIVRDEEVFCPLCGHAAPATSWYTTEQVEWARQNAVGQFTPAARRPRHAEPAGQKQARAGAVADCGQ